MVTPIKDYRADHFYHVYNRGNRQQQIFFRPWEYERFLAKYVELSAEYPITTFAFCLMRNHFHFLVQPGSVDAITQLFHRLSTSHAKYINIKYELTGSLFQRDFQAKRIDEESHLLHTHRYIHRNPIDTIGSTRRVEPMDVLEKLTAYPWSSLSQYLTGATRSKQPTCNVDLFYEIAGIQSTEKYKQFLMDDIELSLMKRDMTLSSTRRVELRC